MKDVKRLPVLVFLTAALLLGLRTGLAQAQTNNATNALLNAAPVKMAPLSVTPPIINAKGTSGAGVAVGASVVTVVGGDPTRKAYTIMCTAAVMCENGDTLGDAPATTPSTTVGMMYQANTYFREADVPGDRMDCTEQAISTPATCYVKEIF